MKQFPRKMRCKVFSLITGIGPQKWRNTSVGDAFLTVWRFIALLGVKRRKVHGRLQIWGSLHLVIQVPNLHHSGSISKVARACENLPRHLLRHLTPRFLVLFLPGFLPRQLTNILTKNWQDLRRLTNTLVSGSSLLWRFWPLSCDERTMKYSDLDLTFLVWYPRCQNWEGHTET